MVKLYQISPKEFHDEFCLGIHTQNAIGTFCKAQFERL